MGIFNRIRTEIEARDKKEEGITPSDLLDLPPQLSRLMNRITRKGEMTVEEAAEHLEECPRTPARCWTLWSRKAISIGRSGTLAGSTGPALAVGLGYNSRQESGLH